MGHARNRGSRGWVTARGHPAKDALEHFEDRLAEFENWANDVRSMPQPRFLPGNLFLKRLIRILQRQLPEIRRSIFFVYIDEYEKPEHVPTKDD